MTSPSVADVRPCRSERARSLRWKPSSSIASVTRLAVSTATPGSELITRETVLRLTPARSATWRIVGRLIALVVPTTLLRRQRCQRSDELSRHEFAHAPRIELAGRRVLDAGGRGGDRLAGGVGEVGAALQRRGERRREHVAGADRGADRDPRRGQ